MWTSEAAIVNGSIKFDKTLCIYVGSKHASCFSDFPVFYIRVSLRNIRVLFFESPKVVVISGAVFGMVGGLKQALVRSCATVPMSVAV